jgi:hypothetical protein
MTHEEMIREISRQNEIEKAKRPVNSKVLAREEIPTKGDESERGKGVALSEEGGKHEEVEITKASKFSRVDACNVIKIMLLLLNVLMTFFTDNEELINKILEVFT